MKVMDLILNVQVLMIALQIIIVAFTVFTGFHFQKEIDKMLEQLIENKKEE